MYTMRVEYLLIGYFLNDRHHKYEGSDIDHMISKKLSDNDILFTLTFNTELFHLYAKNPETDLFAVETFKGVTNIIAERDVDSYEDYIEVFFDTYQHIKFDFIQLPIFGFQFDPDIMQLLLDHASVVTSKNQMFETFAMNNKLILREGEYSFERRLGLNLNGKRFLIKKANLRF